MNNSRRKVLRLSSAGPLHAVLAAALLIVMQTSSTARVYVGIAPPVPIVEVVPAAPGPGYYWIPGYWIWDGGRYVWRTAIMPFVHVPPRFGCPDIGPIMSEVGIGALATGDIEGGPAVFVSSSGGARRMCPNSIPKQSQPKFGCPVWGS